MDRNFAVVTIFTFLFSVSAARITLDPKPSDLHLVQTNCGLKSLPESTTEDSISNLVVLPTETTRSRSDRADDRVQKSENDRMFRVDLTPRSDFARFHAINRRFSDQRLRFDHHRTHRRFENPFVMPRSDISNKNEVIVSKTGGFDARNLHRRGPATRLKVNHDYGHHRHHQHHHIHQDHHNSNDASMRKHSFASEKVKSLVHQHMEKTKEHEASFMKSIRKFLKHTFN